MQFPQRLARFNRHVTNPIQRMWAGIPGVPIVLTYGPDRDRLKNLTAAGGGRMRRNAKTFGITDASVVSKDEAAQYITGRWRAAFARLPFEQAVLLTKTG